MKGRWIIRGFFIGVLLLFVGGWVVSYQYALSVSHLSVSHNGPPGHWRSVVCFRGKIGLSWFNGYSPYLSGPPPQQGWQFQIARISSTERSGSYSGLLGFRLTIDQYWKFLDLPFWFPTLLSAALLWLVWRKTRPKVNPATAFPVQMREKQP